jgi:hypothetical protein
MRYSQTHSPESQSLIVSNKYTSWSAYLGVDAFLNAIWHDVFGVSVLASLLVLSVTIGATSLHPHLFNTKELVKKENSISTLSSSGSTMETTEPTSTSKLFATFFSTRRTNDVGNKKKKYNMKNNGNSNKGDTNKEKEKRAEGRLGESYSMPSSISFKDILDSRTMLLPEQPRMPMHILSWTPHYDFTMWTLKNVTEDLNVDDRSSGAVDFLFAVALTEFADRFDSSNAANLPLHLGWATQDYPQNPCAGSSSGCGSMPSPIFTFGTVPKDPTKIAGLLQAPTLPLTPCIAHAYNPDKYSQCEWFSSPSECSEDKMYIEPYGSNAERIDKFNTLTPKLVWRGSDWRYLSEYESVGTGSGFEFVHNLNLCHASKADIVKAVLDSPPADTVEKRVPPRFYAAVLGSLNPESFDIKFTKRNEHAPQSTCIDDKFNLFTDDEMDACEYSKYKYLADFGGGGGTSWKSTLWFLGMPGVLFHHETPMRDSFYDDIQPWVHYIPLNEDLSNLEERVNWAKENPDECASISKRATQFAQKMMTSDGLIEHTKKTFVEPLRRYIDAYEIPPRDEKVSTTDLSAKYSNGILETVKYAPTEPAYLGNAERGG